VGENVDEKEEETETGRRMGLPHLLSRRSGSATSIIVRLIR